jgi:hypothetical protein
MMATSVEKITVKLRVLLQQVNDGLKFAETKNAVLLAFAGAGITSTLTYLSANTKLPDSLQTGFIITTFFLCLCALCCSVSFLPKINLEHILWKQKQPSRRAKSLRKDTDNLYYFGHLQKYQADELLEALNRLYYAVQTNTPPKKEDLDIANQITINSEIAFLKFKIFTFALYFLIFSIITIPICMLISLIVYRRL